MLLVLSLLWGEDTGLSINNYLTDRWDNFNEWRFMFVETKPQTMKTYFLLKVTKGENVFFEVHETEEQATRTAEQYYYLTPSKIIVEIKEVKETRPVFHRSKN